jgi:hypothetical protein
VIGGELRRAAKVGPIFFFTLLTVAQTWPLASNPAHLVYDNADVELNAWIVSWIAHQLPRDPTRLFDANIFYPDPNALAFSEPLLPPGILAIVPRGLGAPAVLTHNLLLMGGFLVTAFAGYVVGERLSGDRWAGLLAGSAVAFGPHTLAYIAHLQSQWLATLPLSLLALDAVLRGRSWGAALGLGACVALLAVTSGYGLSMGLVALAAGWTVRAGEWWRQGRVLVPRLVAGAVVAVLLASPVVVAYGQVMRELGTQRESHDVASAAAVPASFVCTPSRLHHGLWSHRFDKGRGGMFFPGFAVLALAALAVVRGPGWRDPRVRMLASVAVVGGLVAHGPSTPLYGALLAAFPPARALRDPSRFAGLVVIGLGLLAAIGLGAIRRRLAGRRRLIVAMVLVGIVNAEVLCAPFAFIRYDGVSPVYARLAAEAQRVALAEFPFYAGAADYRNAAYVLASTAHWTPLVNGYSGAAPGAYEQRAEILKLFPDPAAVVELDRLGVSHVIVHPARHRPGHRKRVLAFLESWQGVEQLATGPSGERLYRILSSSP